MNDFEGINTGKWFIREIGGFHEAECSKCGYCMPVAVRFNIETLKTECQQLPVYCPRCDEDMFRDVSKLYTAEKPKFAVGRAEPTSKSLVINCEKIVLEQKSLGITVDISENIDNIDTVEINGAKFVREVK